MMIMMMMIIRLYYAPFHCSMKVGVKGTDLSGNLASFFFFFFFFFFNKSVPKDTQTLDKRTQKNKMRITDRNHYCQDLRNLQLELKLKQQKARERSRQRQTNRVRVSE